MFIIEIKRRYKYNYIIKRNNSEIYRTNTKKQAKDELFKLYKSFIQSDKEQTVFRHLVNLLQNGETLIIYTEKRKTFDDISALEFKDVYRVQRVVNTNY